MLRAVSQVVINVWVLILNRVHERRDIIGLERYVTGQDHM